MPNVATVLKEEIVRLAKKQVRAEIGPLRMANAEFKRSIASLRRESATLQRRIKYLEKGTPRVMKSADAPGGAPIRFSPKWVVNDRARLELSAKDYAALVGVTQLTIYNWEKGKSRPHKTKLEAWARVRAMGKREAWNQLDA